MISLYIHIPFCDVKCDYCNFYVVTGEHTSEKIKSDYIMGISKEITQRSDKLIDKDVKSIYFGGGTPSSIGKEGILQILYSISCYFNLEDLTEISCELNPNPYEKTIDMIEQLPRLFPAPRRRFSIGIQTFDDEILKQSGRGYFFNNLKGYLRQLRDIKQQTHVFNLDFIAFGRPGATQVWNENRREFFENMVRSHSFDSISLYQLELFPGSKRHQLTHTLPPDPLLKHLVKPDDDTVMQEWEYLHDVILESGYQRYEVSNYALAGQDSIHNHVYRACEPYLGIGTAASGLLYREQLVDSQDLISGDSVAVRYTNRSDIMKYFAGDYIDETKTQHLSGADLIYEKAMLGLRTKQGLWKWEEYKSVMVDDVEVRISNFINDGLMSEFNGWLKLTDDGMNVANRLISELLR